MFGAQIGRLFLIPARAVSDAYETKEAECTLTLVQAFLALGCLLITYINPIEASLYTLFARLSLLLYASFSTVMVVALRLQSEQTRWPRLFLHFTGIVWVAITFLFNKNGGGTIFLVFLLYILFAAAFRWGLAQTLLTALGCASLLLLASRIAASIPQHFPALVISGPSPWTIAISLLGCLLVYLLEREKRLRAETLATNRLIAGPRAGAGMRATLQEILQDSLELFSAKRILVAVQSVESGQSFIWDADRQDGAEKIQVQLHELATADQDTYFFAFPGVSWCATVLPKAANTGRFRVKASGKQDGRLRRASCFLPYGFLSRHVFHSLAAVSFSCEKKWSGRIFVFDPRRRTRVEEDLRFLQQLVCDVVPVVYGLYLPSRLRSRVRELERTRMAQDLHDGVIQSLVSLEMQLVELRRRAGANGISEELRLIEGQVNDEIQDFRDLMERVRPVDLDPSHPTDRMGEIVDQFRIRTGIATSYVCDCQQITVSPRVGYELVRILQEALVNVRKHSGAHKVLVRCGPVGGHLRLTIEDDGRGFGFSGRLSFAELEATGKGPAIIKERLRSIGGECALESVPGGGARLEILLPV